MGKLPHKADERDLLGRFREVISDPLNLLIERVPLAGVIESNEVYLHNGNRVPASGSGAYYGNFSQLLSLNRGVHEPLEEYVFQEVLRVMPPAPAMIELGAYWAHYSMWLKKVRADAQVVMVEPDPANLKTGQRNFERNGFSGEFILASVRRGQWELDVFMEARSIRHLNILHTDIQGWEVEMIEGGREAFANAAVDYVFVSTHSQDLHAKVQAMLASYGYRIEVSSDFDNATTSYDGFVFSTSPRSRPIFRDFSPLGRNAIAACGADDLLGAIEKARVSRALE